MRIIADEGVWVYIGIMLTILPEMVLVLGQGVSELKDPAVPDWIVMVVAGLLVALMLWGSFRNSKRTHQD